MPAYPAAQQAAPRIHAHLRDAMGDTTTADAHHLPDVDLIARVLDTAFWASLRREEGVEPTISLALIPAAHVDLPLTFARPLPLAAAPLARLAPAVERPGIHLGVWVGADGAHVWGTTLDLPPLTLVVEVVSPGLLVAKYRRDEGATKYTNILVLEGDEVRVLDLSVPRRPECPGLVTSLFGFDSLASWVASADVLVQLAVSMRAHGRGGALIVVPPDEGWRTSAVTPVTYDVQPSYRGLRDLAAAGEVSHPHGQWPPAVGRAIAGLAGLTAVDGATIISRGYDLLAFGVKLVRRKGWPAVESLIVTEPIEGRPPVRVHPVQLGGTRHLSAAQFVHDQHDAVAMVASQDGRFTVLSWSASRHAVHAHRVESLLL